MAGAEIAPAADATAAGTVSRRPFERQLRILRSDPVRLWMLPALVVFLIFYILPIAKLLVRSIYENGFTLRHYEHLVREPVYLDAFVTTFRIAAVTTVGCILVGYPIAYLMKRLRPPTLHLVLAIVLIPFWTSVLVRSYAFVALLSRSGIVNKTLLGLGLIERPLPLLYNETGVVIGMTYVLLPIMTLTLYSAMHGIDDRTLAASDSLGARPFVTFLRIFLPLSLPGIQAGALLVFVTALGFFITPALLGGGRVPMIATMIESQMHGVLNWGLGSALSVALLATTMLMFVLLDRTIGMESLIRKH